MAGAYPPSSTPHNLSQRFGTGLSLEGVVKFGAKGQGG